MAADTPLSPWQAVTIDGFTLYRIPAGEFHLAPGSTAAGLPQERRSQRPPHRQRPPVLLLNGCAMPAGGWTPVLAGLHDHDVIAIDRPGFVGTPWDGMLPDLASEVALIQHALRGTGLSDPDSPHERRAIIVAHSMASFRAEALARLRPEFVHSIVLVDPSIETYSDQGFAARFLSAAAMQALSRALSPWQIREFAATVLHRGFLRQIGPGRELDRDVFKDPYAESETLKSAFAEWLSYRSQAAALTALRAHALPVRAPTSVIFADEDPSSRQLRALQTSFADLRVRELKDSGHLVMIDRPDVIIRAVEENAAR